MTQDQHNPRQASVWQEARQLIWQRRGRLGLGLVLIVVSRLAGLVLPASTGIVVDEVLGDGGETSRSGLREALLSRVDLAPADLLLWLTLAVATATAVQAVTSFSLSQLLGIAAHRAIAEMRKSVQQHVLRLPVSFFDSTKSGVLISRIMTDADGLRNLVGTGLVQLIGSLLTATIALAWLFHLNWKLTSVTLVVLLAFGGLMAAAFNKVRPLFRARGEINAQVTGRLGESLGGARVVKAYTAEKREDRIFAGGAHRLLRNVASSITAVSAVSSSSTLIFGVIGALMMFMGGSAVLNKEMSLGDLIQYVFFTGLVAAPMVQISSVATQLGEAFAGLDRIRELRLETTEEEGDAERAPLPAIRGDVAFENVSFEYNPGIPVLNKVSFEAPAGSTTALVGSSGSGKSTLISLVLAFNRPQEGKVRIDGHDLDSVRLHDYRSHLGIVLQDNFLFDGTIAENIAYSNPRAGREEILEAARIAHCDAFVRDFPEGYDTVVGERGVKVSGGQRQRIAIARAILADPKLLILDEATSSLDSESEALIQAGLEALRSGRTTFVIAHRLSTIRSADQILVLEDGEIVERGAHEELLARGGRYRELYDKQYKLEKNRFINPGEDFTPEPPTDTAPPPRAARPTAL